MKHIRTSLLPLIIISSILSVVLFTAPSVVYGDTCSSCSAKIVFTGADRAVISLSGSFDGGTEFEPFTSMYQDGNTEYYNLSGPIIFRATNSATSETIQKDSITFVANSGDTGGQVTVTFAFTASARRSVSHSSIQQQTAQEQAHTIIPSTPAVVQEPVGSTLSGAGKFPPSFLIPKRDFADKSTEVAIVVRKSPSDPKPLYLQADGTPADRAEWRAWYKWGYDTADNDPLNRRVFVAEEVKPATYYISYKFRSDAGNETAESNTLVIRPEQFQ
ncbi:hypothetical protein HZA86_04330 [Candidatus Uhrbacteria bacterium]|nr:hypothetical protein [Candidatus Uhrbacteria bacterium]